MAETGSGGFDVSKLGGMMGGQGGGKSNFMDAVVNAEKDAWAKYINSTNLQQQAVLPTQAKTEQKQAPKQQPQPTTQPAGEQKPIVVVQPQQQEQPTVDPAFADYKKTAVEADDLKKKKAIIKKDTDTTDSTTL